MALTAPPQPSEEEMDLDRETAYAFDADEPVADRAPSIRRGSGRRLWRKAARAACDGWRGPRGLRSSEHRNRVHRRAGAIRDGEGPHGQHEHPPVVLRGDVTQRLQISPIHQHHAQDR